MYEKFIQERINELRMKKNISEYQLSLDLGHSQGYIQSITSGRNLPSMGAFLEVVYIILCLCSSALFRRSGVGRAHKPL